MKIKNTAPGPRGYMQGKKAVVLQPGEEGECPDGTALPAGLEEIKPAPKPAPAPKEKLSAKTTKKTEAE